MFNAKKKYFKHKLNGVQKAIWDLEFKKEKNLMIREEVRREYDGARAKLSIIVAKINSQLKDPNKICEVHNPEKGKEKVHKEKGKCACQYIETALPSGDIERLYDEKERLSETQARHEGQMKKIDLDVNGSAPTNEYPDGLQGFNDELEALRELFAMVKQHLSKI